MVTPSDGVTATRSLSGAAAVPWHVLVVGAGPAGSACAFRLAGRGLRVLLVDAASMPRPKVCGCCLSRAAVDELGLLAGIGGAALPGEAVPLERVHLATAGGAAAIPLRGGSVVSREALDTAAVRGAISRGADWLPRVRVVAIREQELGGVVVEAVAGAPRAAAAIHLRAGLVIVAAGLAAAIRMEAAGAERRVVAQASRVGVGATLGPAAGGPPPGELVMAVSRRGYCGIVRLEDGRIDLAAALDRRGLAAAGGPAPLVAAILAETGGDRAARLDHAAALAAASFRGTPPLWSARPVATPSGRIVRVGDAAGYVEPFTGEGIGWALASARLLDDSLGPAVDGPAAGLAAAAARYAAAHAGLFAGHHARCRRVALAVRRPWLVGSLAGLARLAPRVAARAVPLVIGPAAYPQAQG